MAIRYELWHKIVTMVQRRPRTAPKPLDTATLDALALAYVGKYATTRAKLLRYLERKLRERGVADGVTPDPHAIADRMVGYGYIDDAGFAHNRAVALSARGYGERRVRGVLAQAGVDREIVDSALPPDEARARAAAETYARRRRFGPYAAAPIDRDVLRKQLAAMLRAGHDFGIALTILKAEQS
jgi:regulatory protein